MYYHEHKLKTFNLNTSERVYAQSAWKKTIPKP